MTRLSLRFHPSKPFLAASLGIVSCFAAVPAAQAVSTAIATASLSFRVSSPDGSIGLSPGSLNEDAHLFAPSPVSTAGYTTTGLVSPVSHSASLGDNSVHTASSVSGSILTSTSSVSLSASPFSFSNGSAMDYNYVNIDISDLRPVDGFFDLKFSSVHAKLDLSLETDLGGTSSSADASWLVSLSYFLPDETAPVTRAVSRSIGSVGSPNESSHTYSSFEFSDIPAEATGVQLYWDTSVDARAVDGVALVAASPVPEGGSALALLGLGLTAMECLRRKSNRTR